MLFGPTVRRLTTLDGLRGSAALAVMFFHADAIAPLRMPGGYLAVDLFFVLSGFVIAAAYLDDFAQLGASGFLKRRFARLYPTYFAGIVVAIGGAGIIALSRGEALGFGPIVAALLILPWPAAGYLFPIYPPAWSLFFEWVANLGMAFTARWFGPVLAGAILIVSGGVVLATAFHDRQISQGVYWNGFGGGLARAVFSFTLGIVLQRFHAARPVDPATTRWALALPVGLFALLALDPADRLWLDLVCVFAIFPAMILIGARLETPNPWAMKLVGDASYPLYCLHGTVMVLALAAARREPALATALGIAACIVTFVAALVFARLAEPRLRKVATRMLRGSLKSDHNAAK